jgi:hypothetical protein
VRDLWTSGACDTWSAALAGYENCVASQPSALLQQRDPWYRLELPRLISERPVPFLMREELVWVVEWKMARGVWRARNLHLARSNGSQEVAAASRAAFAAVPDERSPLKLLGGLKGVGPATASAVLAAYRPELYPFFDDVVAAQVPGLVAGEFTLKAYLAYAAALRARAAELGAACPDGGWTPQAIGLALWAAAGGKLG